MRKSPEQVLDRMRPFLQALASGTARGPYEAAVEVLKLAMSGVAPDAPHLHALWLIWGSLTDGVELRPSERKAAEEKMRQAAVEWLEIEHDPARWDAYCDRWVYDEMGYERPG